MQNLLSFRAWAYGALAALLLAGCSSMTSNLIPGRTTGPSSIDAVKAELAPTGSLRVAVFTGNPLIGSKSDAGEVTGTTVILGKALAKELGVPVFIIEYGSIQNVVEGAATGAWDVAVVGVDPARRGLIDYAPAHLSVDLTYLVPPNSNIRSVDDADKSGVRIAAAKGGVPAIVLERVLAHATLYETDNEAASLAALRTGRVQAIAQNRAMLMQVSDSVIGSRVIDGRFLAAELAFVLPKGRPAALAYVSDFIDKAKASGQVKRAVDEAGLKGVDVASTR